MTFFLIGGEEFNLLKEKQKMSKSLEALEKVLDIISYQKHDDNLQMYIDSVENSLKALEIIKEKLVDIGYLFGLIDLFENDKNVLEQYNMSCVNVKKTALTQEEYELLKEVLCL